MAAKKDRGNQQIDRHVIAELPSGGKALNQEKNSAQTKGSSVNTDCQNCKSSKITPQAKRLFEQKKRMEKNTNGLRSHRFTVWDDTASPSF
ncbi:hypothetical protein ACFSQ7_04175 [Paenibacillus rhizoplanae]